MRAQDRPKGYMARWFDRGRLAAAKHAADLTDGMPDEAFARVLLRSEGNRGTDRYMEVEIYGGFNRDAFLYPPHFDDSNLNKAVNKDFQLWERILRDSAEQKKNRGNRWLEFG